MPSYKPRALPMVPILMLVLTLGDPTNVERVQAKLVVASVGSNQGIIVGGAMVGIANKRMKVKGKII